MDVAQLAVTVDSLMPRITTDLKRLAAIPSIAFPGYPREPVVQCHDLLMELLRDAAVPELDSLDLPGAAPIVTGHIPAPSADAPTVLLYAHYDVQPPGDVQAWISRRLPDAAP